MHLFEIKKKNAIRGYRFQQKPKLCPDYGMKAGRSYEKRKGNNYIHRRKELLLVLTSKLSYSLVIHGLLLIPKNVHNHSSLWSEYLFFCWLYEQVCVRQRWFDPGQGSFCPLPTF